MPKREKDLSGTGQKVKKTISFFLPYWILSFIIIFLVFAVVAVIFMITPLSQSTFPFISSFVFIAVELAVSYLLGRFCKIPAVISGSIYGGGLAVIMLLVGLLTGSIGLFSLKFLFLLITGVMMGIFGAIAGLNFKPKKRYGRYTVK